MSFPGRARLDQTSFFSRHYRRLERHRTTIFSLWYVRDSACTGETGGKKRLLPLSQLRVGKNRLRILSLRDKFRWLCHAYEQMHPFLLTHLPKDHCGRGSCHPQLSLSFATRETYGQSPIDDGRWSQETLHSVWWRVSRYFTHKRGALSRCLAVPLESENFFDTPSPAFAHGFLKKKVNFSYSLSTEHSGVKKVKQWMQYFFRYRDPVAPILTTKKNATHRFLRGQKV